MRFPIGFDTSRLTESIVETSGCDLLNFVMTTSGFIENLFHELHLVGDSNIDRRLKKMYLYLQLTSNFNLDSTREKLKQDANYLNELLCGHSQDWESA